MDHRVPDSSQDAGKALERRSIADEQKCGA
jgi:hypothetical protein